MGERFGLSLSYKMMLELEENKEKINERRRFRNFIFSYSQMFCNKNSSQISVRIFHANITMRCFMNLINSTQIFGHEMIKLLYDLYLVIICYICNI